MLNSIWTWFNIHRSLVLNLPLTRLHTSLRKWKISSSWLLICPSRRTQAQNLPLHITYKRKLYIPQIYYTSYQGQTRRTKHRRIGLWKHPNDPKKKTKGNSCAIPLNLMISKLDALTEKNKLMKQCSKRNS